MTGTASSDGVAAAIASSHLRSLPEQVLAQLTSTARRQLVKAGAVIKWEGDGARHLDLVVTGLVRVFVTAPDGRTLTVRYVRSGGLLGAVSLFAPAFALPATIQAITDAELCRFPPAAVREAAERDVRVARVLIDELTERVLTFIPEIPGSAFATVRQRVVRHLLDLAAERPGTGELLADIGQQDLADAVGTAREVVVRTLRQLREAGLVRTGRTGVVLVPPGIPDFYTRQRVVEAGPVMLSGRAWSGHGPVERVEVGVDGRWAEAELEPASGAFAWRGWHFAWRAAPGAHDLSCRATDAAGHTQPLEAPWNHQGMGNNEVQRLRVTVR